jgi:amino acid transporter
MKLINTLLGRPLSSSAVKKARLTVLTGVPALGLDAFASTGYGPEAALMMLLPLGFAGLHYFPVISMLIVIQLLILYLSYQQTTAAYPRGGGAYIVASRNLGKPAGILAAIALLIDYLLNVSVGIAAGIGVIVSAFPILQPYTLVLCLFVLLTLMILNLRGIRDSGALFVAPVILFITCMSIVIALGFIQMWLSHGHPHAIVQPPAIPAATSTASTWLLLSAFANGLTAMTGIEAVSNAVPIFRKPTVINAQRTLTVIILVLGLFLLALGYLCPAYHVVAMDETQPGYQTILSQLVAAIVGHNLFYYITSVSIFIILTYSAQTSFAGFPRVCRLLAEDDFLPHFFADRGRRLVFSHGIFILALFSAFLLILFDGITVKLIPLFAVGAFTAFTFSQAGMVMYWMRKMRGHFNYKMLFNAVGAITTALALLVIIATKFIEGAWITIIIAFVLFFLLRGIKRHYDKVSQAIEHSLKLQISKLEPPAVIIPIQGWNLVAENAVRFGLLLSTDVTAIYVTTDEHPNQDKLKKLWAEKVQKPAKTHGLPIPKLEIIYSPYRKIYQPILDFVKKTKHEKPDRLVAVVIPELIKAHWYEYLLHNIHAAVLRALLLMKHDQRTVVINTPWYLR